jgi:RND family efflux transporter MFP subunit
VNWAADQITVGALAATTLSGEFMMRLAVSRPLRWGGFVLGCAILLSACSKPAPVAEPIRSVKVVAVGVDALDSHVTYAADIRARVESRLGFRVAGKIVNRRVEVGQRVQAGQLLAEIDAQDYKLSQEAAKAQWQSAQTQLELAAADFRRYKALRDQSFISDAELERRETSLKAAQALVDQARAQLNVQGNQADYTRLLADQSGVVTAIEAEVGQVVTAGTPVIRLAQDGLRDVVFAMPEDQVARVKTGQVLQVQAWGQGPTWSASVREIAASADPLTRTYTVKLALPASVQPALGSTATVQMNQTPASTSAIRLPTSALRQEGAGSAVWVLDSNAMTVSLQAVQLGPVVGSEVVIASGLQAGQQVVVTGVHVLTPGQKVTVFKPVVDATR